MTIINSLPTILVVDDEESFIEALQVGLKREDFGLKSRVTEPKHSPYLMPFAQTPCC